MVIGALLGRIWHEEEYKDKDKEEEDNDLVGRQAGTDPSPAAVVRTKRDVVDIVAVVNRPRGRKERAAHIIYRRIGTERVSSVSVL